MLLHPLAPQYDCMSVRDLRMLEDPLSSTSAPVIRMVDAAVVVAVALQVAVVCTVGESTPGCAANAAVAASTSASAIAFGHASCDRVWYVSMALSDALLWSTASALTFTAG